MTQEIHFSIKLDLQTIWRLNSRLCWLIDIWRLHCVVIKFWRLLGWNCTNWWWKQEKIKFSTLPNFCYQRIGWQVWHVEHALIFYWWHEKTAWCQFRVIWHDWRNHFIHSLAYRQQLALFSPLLSYSWNFEVSSSFTFLDLPNYSKSKFWLSRKTLISENILTPNMT